MAARVNLLGGCPRREHAAAARLQGEFRALQGVREEAAGVGVVVRFGVRQPLHEDRIAFDERLSGVAPVGTIKPRQLGDA